MKNTRAFGFASLLLIAAILISNVARAEAISTAGLFPGTDPDHSGQTVYNPVPVPVCQVDKNIQLNQHDVTLEQLLTFLERFPEAAPHVKDFRAMQARKEIEVGQFTDDIRRDIGGPAGVVATFQYKPGEKVQHIYVDLTGELGVLAIQFYHEMTHSLDPQVRKFYDEFYQRYPEIQAGLRAVFQKVADRLKKPLQEVDFSDFVDADWSNLKNAKRFQNDGQWNAEFLAFTKQMALVTEMKTKIGCLKDYISNQDSYNGVHLTYDDIKNHLYMAYGLYEPETY